jgi:hypothetical protein
MTYRVDGTIELSGRTGLTIDGSGSTFRTAVTGDGQRAHWRFWGGSDLALRNMVIHSVDGVSGTSATFVSSLQWQHGIDLRGVTGFTAQNISISNVYGDCFYVGMAADGSWSTSVRITGSSCRGAGRQGLAIVAGRNVTVDGSVFSGVSLNPFDIEPNGTTGGAADITMTHNTVGSGGSQQVLGIVGDGPVQNVTLDSTTVQGRSLTVAVAAAASSRRSGITLTNNTSDTPAYADGGGAFEIEGTDNLVIEGNTVPVSGPNRALAEVFGSCGTTFASNLYPGGVTEYRVFTAAC